MNGELQPDALLVMAGTACSPNGAQENPGMAIPISLRFIRATGIKSRVLTHLKRRKLFTALVSELHYGP
jgi:hypothetical protein